MTGEDQGQRVAIVTGAAGNIGRATALALAQQGFSVLVHAGSNKAGAEETADLVADTGVKAQVVLGDLTDPEMSGTLAETGRRLGQTAVLVNNAALRRAVSFEEMDLQEWRSVLSVNLDAAFLCCRAVIGDMVANRWGRIVNIGGMTGHCGASGRAHVVTSKAALVGLSKALAIEFADRGVTANCVVPGEIETLRGPSAGVRAGHHGKALPPVGRRGLPAEVAAVIAMICGPQSDYLTGQTFHVNGGTYLP